MCPQAGIATNQWHDSETLRQFAPISDISQGSVATHLSCGGTFNESVIANFLLILTVKQFRKSVNIW